jgi:hypothetical protein
MAQYTTRDLQDLNASSERLRVMDTRLGENPMDQQAKEGKAKEEAFQERIHAEAERRLDAMSQASVSSDVTSTNTGQTSLQSSRPSRGSDRTR